LIVLPPEFPFCRASRRHFPRSASSHRIVESF
jgi:hypothetical protein